MAWLRNGDNAATHPLVMALATVRGADERLMNEAFGFVQRCAMQSAGHMTDGVIDVGTAQLMSPTRWQILTRAAVEAGILVQRTRGKKPSWAIVSDADFIHIRPRAEIEWERQRKRDVANPELTVPVRRRDGDGCRYCGSVVNWRQRRGPRRGTYDHRTPGRAATFETFVVACFACNNERSNDPKADERRPLLPPPLSPIYTADTVEFLARHGVFVTETTATAAPVEQPGHRAPARPESADGAAPPSWAVANPEAAPVEQPGHRAPARPESADGAAPEADPDLQVSADTGRSEVYGPGRDGAGRGGSGAGAGAQPECSGESSAHSTPGTPPSSPPREPSRPRRRRGRRGRRGGGGS